MPAKEQVPQQYAPTQADLEATLRDLLVRFQQSGTEGA